LPGGYNLFKRQFVFFLKTPKRLLGVVGVGFWPTFPLQSRVGGGGARWNILRKLRWAFKPKTVPRKKNEKENHSRLPKIMLTRSEPNVPLNPAILY